MIDGGDIIRKTVIFVLLFILIFNFLNLSIWTCRAKNIIYVDDDVERDYKKIQEAINAASNGDIIYIYNGTYYENIFVNKSITFIGESKETTIINGSFNDDVFHISAEWVNISNFTIINSKNTYPKSGINISSNNNTITGNIIKNNYYGITMYQASYNAILENIISDNNHCGIYLSFSSNNNISKNIIKNHSYNGIGIYNEANSNTIIKNNLTHNSYCGINIRFSSNNNIIENNITDNNIGIHVPSDKYNNRLSNNIFSNNKKDIEKEIEIPFFEMLLIIIIITSIIGVILYRKQKKHDIMVSSEKEKQVMDTSGKLCPVPLIMTKKKIAKMNKGENLLIITTDIEAKENIERYVKENYNLIRIEEKDKTYKIFIKK